MKPIPFKKYFYIHRFYIIASKRHYVRISNRTNQLTGRIGYV
jgi:hypothetical protein